MNKIPPLYLADLNACAQEPIHIPGSIQPHGILLVVNLHDLVIEQHAGDPRFLLGVEASFLSLRSLSIFFEESVLNTLLAHLPDRPTRTPSLALSIHSRTGPLPLNASLHVLGERVFIELEAVRHTHTIHGEPLTRVMSMLAAIQSASNFTALCDAAARHVRAISDFDRVMIYQFLHDGNGAVIAEAKASGQKETFLGLHYPSSDIPSQARDLYLRNWLRFIPDVHYQPAPLVSARTDIGDEPLDMSYCTLRSISPIHIKYLCNMGVGASMSLSIIVDNKLWGLIACHNDTPHYIAAELRIACTLFAKVFSLQLKAKLAADATQRDHASQHVLELLSRTLPKSEDVAMDLISGEVTLLDLIPANGIAIWLNGRLCCRGETPPVEFITELLTWLTGQGLPIFDTFQLSNAFPAAAAYTEIASGLLAISVSRNSADFVLWFRPELVRTVTWAGDPQKPVTVSPHGTQLNPRASFAAWHTEIRQQATPWDPGEIGIANSFRLLLLETIFQQMDLMQQERAAAFDRQSILIAELNHRVKNTLANIQAMVFQTEGGTNTLNDFTKSLQLRIRAMAHAHDLIAATHWAGASLRQLLAKELSPFQSTENNQFTICGDEFLLSKDAALPFTMVVHELITNAAKYGALSTTTGHIEIDWQQVDAKSSLVFTWTEQNGPVVTAPTHRGFGSMVIERSLQHEIQGRSILRFEPEGVVCILTIPPTHLVRNANDGGDS